MWFEIAYIDLLDHQELGGENEEDAIVLGWAVELMRAANNLTAEVSLLLLSLISLYSLLSKLLL